MRKEEFFNYSEKSASFTRKEERKGKVIEIRRKRELQKINIIKTITGTYIPLLSSIFPPLFIITYRLLILK